MEIVQSACCTCMCIELRNVWVCGYCTCILQTLSHSMSCLLSINSCYLDLLIIFCLTKVGFDRLKRRKLSKLCLVKKRAFFWIFELMKGKVGPKRFEPWQNPTDWCCWEKREGANPLVVAVNRLCQASKTSGRNVHAINNNSYYYYYNYITERRATRA